MNQEQRNALLTGLAVLAVMVGGSLLLSTHQSLRALTFGGLLLLAAAGCVVESHRKKPKPGDTKKPPPPTEKNTPRDKE